MRRNIIASLGVTLVVMLVMTTAAAAVDSEVGALILRQECSRCHATGLNDQSPLPVAPPFRDIARRYPPTNLMESLAEGIVTGHGEMPEFEFTPEEVSAIVGYLETLRAQ